MTPESAAFIPAGNIRHINYILSYFRFILTRFGRVINFIEEMLRIEQEKEIKGLNRNIS